MAYCYKYPRPAVAADTVVLGYDGKELKILLIERGGEPYKGYWALPGGFMEMEETAEEGAVRELKEETGLEVTFCRQLGAFTAVHRDPRNRVVSIAYYTFVRLPEVAAKAGDDAVRTEWFDWKELPALAFDHAEMVGLALCRLKYDLKENTIPALSPEEKDSLLSLLK